MSCSSINTSTSSNTRRFSKFVEHIEDTTQAKIDEATHLVEQMERHANVENSMKEWKTKYPQQWEKLNWQTQYKGNGEKYTENPTDVSDAINESVRVHWDEDAMNGLKTKDRKGDEPMSSDNRNWKVNVVMERIASAKKVLCFGSITPDEDFVKVGKKVQAEERSFWRE
ncbi:hypothetical protein DID88_001227 [Monilinia fructigena]|uniref:Uncharacterized protein n=1 Tax=Monilinia fructigena TaxID=38457 RepID=A0A395IY86_9HELO|nr:hypothetical protein DID88_001227 [Monilinia fructigena]